MKANQDGLQVLPWHREAAADIHETPLPTASQFLDINECISVRLDRLAVIIARHDPHESPLFTSRVLVPKLNAEIESLKAHHAETLRLLERASEYVEAYEKSEFLRDEIRAHLAAHRQTGGGK